MATYEATFRRAGCTNATIYRSLEWARLLAWWRTQDSAVALGDMHEYCHLVATRQANREQRTVCCGADAFCDVVCNQQQLALGDAIGAVRWCCGCVVWGRGRGRAGRG